MIVILRKQQHADWEYSVIYKVAQLLARQVHGKLEVSLFREAEGEERRGVRQQGTRKKKGILPLLRVNIIITVPASGEQNDLFFVDGVETSRHYEPRIKVLDVRFRNMPVFYLEDKEFPDVMNLSEIDPQLRLNLADSLAYNLWNSFKEKITRIVEWRQQVFRIISRYFPLFDEQIENEVTKLITKCPLWLSVALRTYLKYVRNSTKDLTVYDDENNKVLFSRERDLDACVMSQKTGKKVYNVYIGYGVVLHYTFPSLEFNGVSLIYNMAVDVPFRTGKHDNKEIFQHLQPIHELDNIVEAIQEFANFVIQRTKEAINKLLEKHYLEKYGSYKKVFDLIESGKESFTLRGIGEAIISATLRTYYHIFITRVLQLREEQLAWLPPKIATTAKIVGDYTVVKGQPKEDWFISTGVDGAPIEIPKVEVVVVLEERERGFTIHLVELRAAETSAPLLTISDPIACDDTSIEGLNQAVHHITTRILNSNIAFVLRNLFLGELDDILNEH